MTASRKDFVNYRMKRARDVYDDALILAENDKWNSTMNRLYYAAYYAVTALLLLHDSNPATHNGTKSEFSEHFIKKGYISKEQGKMYSQLFNWRHKGDYDDLFDFDEQQIRPYIGPVKEFIDLIESLVKK